MSGLVTKKQPCNCSVCIEKSNLIAWLDGQSIPYKLSKNGWPITDDALYKRYKREFLLELIKAMAIHNARNDHDNEK